jgi:DNA-binding NarL/FixJ family response regulator
MEILTTEFSHKKTKQSIILIVEDHDGIRHSIKQWLSKVFEKNEIIEATTGEDAVEICKKMKPDVVIMDIKLPGINGIVATKQIKKALPDTKVIMLTVYDIPAFQTGALEAGADAFISKNDMYTKLIPTIQSLCHDKK